MKNIVILGAGDFAKEVAWLIEDINKLEPTYNVIGCLDDDEARMGNVYKSIDCVGPISDLPRLAVEQSVCAVIAMQSVDARKAIVERYPEFSNWETLIHPSANVADTSLLGEGCVLCTGVVVGVNCRIGKHCLFNIHATIGHDCVLGNYNSIMSGSVVCGHVTVGDQSYLATNCTVVPGRKIGAHATVGAGSVAIRNVRDNSTVLGVPAKAIRF